MPLVPFEVFAELKGVTVTLPGYAASVGLSVDAPLPDKISGTRHVIGHIPLYPFVTFASFGPTAVTVNVGPGVHYVIFGIDTAVPALVAIAEVRLRLSGAGLVVDKTFGAVEPVQFVYIAFEVTKEGAIKPVSSGVIAPGGVPIATSGGGGLAHSDFSVIMAETMGIMLQMMVPLMMINMMMQLMMGLMQGITGAFAGGVVW